MKILKLIIAIYILAHGTAVAQTLQTKTSYYDPYTATKIHEKWTVISGTLTKQGNYTEYDRNGDVIQKATFENNKLNGERVWYYVDNGFSTGLTKLKQTFQNGRVVEEYSYKRDGTKNYYKKANGNWTYYDSNGSVSLLIELWLEYQWKMSPSGSDYSMPKGDDLCLIGHDGNRELVKSIKWYLGGKLVSENLFDPMGISYKNFSKKEDGTRVNEWSRDVETSIYTEKTYDDQGEKQTVKQFIIEPAIAGNYDGDVKVVPHGKTIIYQNDGELIHDRRYEYGQKDGSWKYYYDSDWNEVTFPEGASFYRDITYEKGKPVGIVKDYFIDGTLQWEGQLTSDFPDVVNGNFKFYSQDGMLIREESYKNNLKHGTIKEYDNRGNLSSQNTYSEGNSLSSTQYYENGNKKSEQVYKTIEYSDNPNLSIKAKLLVGDAKLYRTDGSLESEGLINYNTDPAVKIKEWKYYDSNGKVIKEEVYDRFGKLTSSRNH